MRCGVVRCHEGVVSLLERRGGSGQGELVIIQVLLKADVCFYPIQATFAFGAFNVPMADLQPCQNRLECLGGEGPATVRAQDLRDAIVETGRTSCAMKFSALVATLTALLTPGMIQCT
jgi:hypothetical protein